jgi:ABC-2 type transport system ATP-binding protein
LQFPARYYERETASKSANRQPSVEHPFMSVIETRALCKNYGKIEALRGVSLTVARGEVFGLLGQNGAGKTTLIKVLLGIAWKTDGDAMLLGSPIGDAAVRERVGYLPEDHRFPGHHSGWSLMDFYGKLMGLERRHRRRRSAELLELVGLTKRMYSKVSTYSKGMKQRLGVAQAILHDPDVIFLDEPTDGVDPVGRREIRAIMDRLRDDGKTVFLNSHLLGEVELICDRVAIMQRGEIIREGTVEALTRMSGLYTIGLAPGEVFPRDEIIKHGYQATPEGDFWEVGLADGQTIDSVVRLLVAHDLNLRHLVEKRQTLEDQFVEVVTGNGNHKPKS